MFAIGNLPVSTVVDRRHTEGANWPDDSAGPSLASTKIVFQDVSKSFKSGGSRMLALDRVDLAIGEREFVSILGESGCGKTTLLRIAAGLVKPSSGQITIDGRPVKRPGREMGFVFQQPVLLEWRTVLENILLPIEIFGLDTREYRAKALELLHLMGLTGFEAHFPLQLSGGMQQRVAIARALIFSPSVLLMDEPFGALDAITREQMNTELLKVWSATSCTALFITHDIAEAAFMSDRVVLLGSRPGRVKRIFDVDLPRPRTPEHRFDDRFIRVCRDMKHAMSE
jgi:NitT/TauT family transport system ATP-binding protein